MKTRPESLGRCLRFGVFELDTKASELRKHGVRIRLQEQPFKLLLCLLENPGVILSRQELASELWPEGVFVDYEHGLNAAVTRLRQALRDSAENPRYIETVARKGYRFIAPVVEMPVSEPTTSQELRPEPTESGPQPAPSRSARHVWLALGMLMALLTIGLLVILLPSRPSTPEYHSAVPLTSETGAQLCPSFAPDGERVAFSWDGEKRDNFDIYVKQIGGGAPLRLTNDPRPDLSPAWSPDGRTIAFVRVSPDDTADVLLIPSLAGGAERRLAHVTAPYADYLDLRMLAWSPDGKWLVISDARSGNASFGLYLLSVKTGEKRRLTLSAVYDDFDPAFSPDGKRLGFVRHSSRFGADVYVLQLSRKMEAQGEPKRLTSDGRQVSSPVWTDGGRALLYVRYIGPGRHSLWRIALADSPRLEPLPISAENAFALALSPHGDRLVYSREINNTNIWSVDLPVAHPANKATALPRPWSASGQKDTSPSFSPDGLQVAFHSLRSGWSEIWMANRDGSHPRQLTELKGAVAGFPHWSPDSQRIVFHSRQQSYARLFVLDLPTGRPRPLPYPAVDDFLSSWSRDGKWIYFSSRRTGNVEVWKVSAQGGPVVQVTKHGGWAPLESLDGQSVFYTKPDNSLWRIPLSGGEEQQVLSQATLADGSAFTLARDGIYFIRAASSAGKQSLVFFRFADGRMTTLAGIPGPIEMGLTASPDERTFLYSQIDHVSSELMLVEKFR